MREPKTLPMSEWPLDPSASGIERHERTMAITDPVVTDEHGGIVMFRSEEDVEALLSDSRFGAVAMPILALSGVTEGPLYELWSLLMFGKDGHEHRRLRSAVAPFFRPSGVERYRPEIEQFANDLADRAEGMDSQPIDLWSDFGLPLAARSACCIVGIPEHDADMVGAWAIDLVNAFFPMNDGMRERAERAAVEFVAYLDGHIADKRNEPGDDLTSRLIGACSEPNANVEHDLTADEIRALIANLVFGGLEATAKGVTTGVFHLLDRGAWSDLVARPELARHAVIELLRFAPPVGAARLAPQDLVACDVQLRAGQLAVLDIQAACHDPRRYEQPDSLVLDRDPSRQMAFGAGPHFCLGAQLAKVILETGLVTLATRWPSLTLAGDGAAVTWDYETFRGIVSLPVVLCG